MTRAELVELLQVERHLPLPPVPKEGVPYDDPKMQRARQQELDTAVESFDLDQRNKKRRAEATPRLVKKGLIYRQERTAA